MDLDPPGTLTAHAARNVGCWQFPFTNGLGSSARIRLRRLVPSGTELPALLGLHIDLGAGHVRWQQVGSELDARQVGGEVLGERLDGAGLREPRQALDQKVA